MYSSLSLELSYIKGRRFGLTLALPHGSVVTLDAARQFAKYLLHRSLFLPYL